MLEYLYRFPAMHVEIVTELHLVDIVCKGFDAGTCLAGKLPRDMIAVPFREAFRFCVVASPAHLINRNRPQIPKDLLSQQCIRAR